VTHDDRTAQLIRLVRRRTPRALRSRVRSSLLSLCQTLDLTVPPAAAAPVAAGTAEPAPADASQHGEVSALRALLKDGFPRSLVDVGAYDGAALSNSRPFILEGWQAVLIEPHPVQFSRLQRLYANEPAVRCVNKACSDAPGLLPLYLGADGEDTMMSTLCSDNNPWFRANRSDTAVEVEVDTLTGVLDAASFPADFSILLVDAEGMDYEVLRGLDLERYRPRIVVTEEYISNPAKHNAKYRLLLDSGYTFHSMVGCNTMWIRNEWVATCLGL
jgi:FkbM family methyltransferase